MARLTREQSRERTRETLIETARTVLAENGYDGCSIAEITDKAISLDQCEAEGAIALIFGNEVDGVLSDTLLAVDSVAYIPMLGIKESLNVGQSAAIMMRHFRG